MRIVIALFMLFQLICPVFSGEQTDDERYKILILHSYHKGMSWTDNITNSIVKSFEDYSEPCEFYIEYMDTKRNTKPEYLETLAVFYRKKSRNVHFDGIIISDNNALEFYRKYQDTLFPDLPAVFCGINNYTPALIEGIDNITGVEEYTDFAKTIELMKTIHPTMRELVIINDDKTTTAKENKKILEALPPSLWEGLEPRYLENLTFAELEAQVAAMEKDQGLLLLTYTLDKNLQFRSYTEMIQKLSRISPVPIYGPWEFYIGEGLTGGLITSGYTQGQLASELMKKVLSGTPASELPVTRNREDVYTFDYNLLEKFNIPRGILPKNTVIINTPPNFVDRNKNIIFICSIVLILISLVLALFSAYQKHQKKQLKRLNRELDQQVMSRTMELQQANKNKDRLLSIITHDIKSPLISLKNLISLQAMGAIEDKADRARVYGDIQGQIERVSLTVNTILSWSSTQMKDLQLKLEECRFDLIIEQTADQFRARIDKKKISLSISTRERRPVLVDKNIISSILRNLISNAIKFSPSGSKIIISQFETEDDIGFIIKDQGIGMEPELLKQIENRKNVASRRGTGDEKGSGVGLQLCQDLAEFHQGSLEIESRLNKGTAITVTLPLISR